MKNLISDLRAHRIIIVFLLLVLVVWGTSTQLGFNKPKVTVAPSITQVGLGFIPAASAFGLYNVQGFISSPYWDEASLVNYAQPTGDYDYMLPYGIKENPKLPGDSRNVYRFIGGNCIPGSGWFETFETKNGGYFAFLHLSSPWEIQTTYTCQYGVGVVQKQPVTPGTAFLPQNNNAIDYTGLDAEKIFGKNIYSNNVSQGLIPGTSQLIGGTAVGLSGWPTWSQYAGGGPGGASDSHLCVVVDTLSQVYFLQVAYQGAKPKPAPKPKPFKFNWTQWNGWTQFHHKKSISPLYKGKYTNIAKPWNKAPYKYGSVVSAEKWNAKGKYNYQRFQAYTLFVWTNGGFKAAKTRFVH